MHANSRPWGSVVAKQSKKSGKQSKPTGKAAVGKRKATKLAVTRIKPALGAKAGKTTAIKKSGHTALVDRLFGTDGVRDTAGRGALTPERILALGRALGRFLADQTGKDSRPMVLLGVDPRPSADLVGTALAAGLIAEHCDVHWPGMMSTPEVAFLTGHGPFAAGISVTASHNPAEDNGIKVFGKDGRKISVAVEKRLEKAVLSGGASGEAPGDDRRFGWLQLGRERHYENYIVKTFRKSFASLKKRPIAAVIDAAYGARSIDLQLLSNLAHSLAFGKTEPEYRIGSSMAAGGEAADNALDIYFLNAASPNQPDTHFLINRNCGSLHPEGCARAVRELKADIGICFDGDGDRCILIDETGAVRDGDYMLALLATDMKNRGVLRNDVVVSTIMANLGLERALSAIGVKLVRTDVGDRHVLDAMHEHAASLGGEQSGHIILADEGHLAGDGLYTALRVIEVMLDTGKRLSELCAPVTKFPQRITNLRVKAKPALNTLKNLSTVQKKIETTIGDKGRINVRYSGTEPLLRIMVEAVDDDTLDTVSNQLSTAARKDLD
jgi:phosphoglucosamine mutase